MDDKRKEIEETDEEKYCMECAFFFQDKDETDINYGVCMENDSIFEPYIDDIIETDSFQSCRELYEANKFDGGRAPCKKFEEREIVENYEAELMLESIRNTDVTEAVNNLDKLNCNQFRNLIRSLHKYISLGNRNAYECLLDYLRNLSAVESLEETHKRLELIDALVSRPDDIDDNLIEVFINELYKNPSNNTTRQLYTKILGLLERCPVDMIEGPLLDLLHRKKYGYRMIRRIQSVIEEARNRCYYHNIW